jgi:hypothetical protein
MQWFKRGHVVHLSGCRFRYHFGRDAPIPGNQQAPPASPKLSKIAPIGACLSILSVLSNALGLKIISRTIIDK